MINIGHIEITAEDAVQARAIINNPVFEKILRSLVFQSIEEEDLHTRKNHDKESGDYVRLKQSLKREVLADLVDELNHFTTRADDTETT